MTVENQTGQLCSFQAEMGAIKATLQATQAQCQDKERKIQDLNIVIDQKNETIHQLESQIREDEVMRKKLHNTIQVADIHGRCLYLSISNDNHS